MLAFSSNTAMHTFVWASRVLHCCEYPPGLTTRLSRSGLVQIETPDYLLNVDNNRTPNMSVLSSVPTQH